jgi:HAE1 family hydrophobic/amphiphilic exporter-1
MNLTKFALRRPVTVFMIFFAVILMGVISLQRLSLELLPSMNFPQLTILTSYENVASPEIESLLSKPIEEAVGTVKGLKRITSISKEGVSLVTLDFEWGVDTNLATLDVREKVDAIKDSLPKDVENPIIIKFDPSSFPIITLGISGPENLAELTRTASEEIKQKLERIPGVALARVSGGLEREILISVDQGRLFAYGIPINRVVDILENANFNFPGGKIEKSKGVIRIRTMGQFERLEDLENVVVSKGKTGGPVFLNDVATVIDTFKEQTSSFLINGKKSIGISIFKQADSNTVQVSEAVFRVVERLNQELNSKTNIVVVYNQATFIKDSISDLQLAGILGGILAFSVLLIFLRSFLSAIIITTAIPISVLGVFSLMFMTDISLNLMSLGGLALGIGLLVDNGIVILENIHRHRRKTPDVYEATIAGSNEMQRPVLASTFAHIIVFLPIVFVKGLTGHFFAQLALTISFSLMISILVALILNPMLETRWRPASKTVEYHSGPAELRRRYWKFSDVMIKFANAIINIIFGPLWRSAEVGIKAAEKFYLRVILLALSNKKEVILIAVLIMIMSIILLPRIGKEFLPNVDQGSFLIKVITPPGTTLKTTEAVTLQIEKTIITESEVKNVFANIGYDKNEKSEKALGDVEPNIAEVRVVLKEERERSVEEMVNSVRPVIAQIPNVETEYILNQNITQILRQKQKSPEILELKGPDLDLLKRLTSEVTNKLKSIPCLKDIQSSLGESEPEIQIVVDREKAATLSLSVKDIADTLKACMEGEVATKFHDADQDVDILVRLRDEDRKDMLNLEQILIHTPLDTDIPLKEVASITLAESLPQIQRRDLNRVSVISANISGIKLSECQERIITAIDKINLSSDHFMTLSDEQEEMDRSFRNLMFALALSVLLVYMLLASLFESFLYPFIIMFAVPLAGVGVILILFLTGFSISLGVYIGGIMLAGIVVNNSIILVDYTNTLRKKGVTQKEAIVEGGMTRLRPILMTALTTILGLLPLAVGIGKGAEIRVPLAITVIGGISTSTVMTLIVIPVVYALFEDIKVRLIKRR